MSTINLYFIRHGYSCSNYIKNTRKIRQRGGKRYSLMSRFKKRVSRPLKMQIRKLASQVKLYNQIQDPVLTDTGIESSIISSEIIRKYSQQPVDLQGVEQVNDFPETFDLVLCSNLRRAMETALYMFPNNHVHSVPYIGEVPRYKALPNTLDNTPLSKNGFGDWYYSKYWDMSQNTSKNIYKAVADKNNSLTSNNNNYSYPSDDRALTTVKPIILDNLLHPYKNERKSLLISEKDITKGPNYNKFLKMLVKTFIPTVSPKKEINIAIVTHSSFIKKNVPKVKQILKSIYGYKLNNNIIIKLSYNLEKDVLTLARRATPNRIYQGCELDNKEGDSMCCGGDDYNEPCIDVHTNTCIDDLCDYQKYVSKKKKSKLKKRFESHKNLNIQTPLFSKSSNNSNC